ncbi:unnamed protein product [Prorocentrum cordatum]|uniref:EF-hand domain-containing protein n=1 Tax=Prorocentrum cordatum TaxID=2364126 RepID=A0ABN9PUY1_9DINO|nr:unnamed protein product [Polarella glacialis]
MASFHNSFHGAPECNNCSHVLSHTHKFCPRCGAAASGASLAAPSSFVSSQLGRKRLFSGDSDEGSEMADCGREDLLQELQENERLTDRITELERLKAELAESWLQKHQQLESSLEELHLAEHEEAEAQYQASLEEERAASNQASPGVPSPSLVPVKMASKPLASILAEQVRDIVQVEHHLKDEDDYAHLVEDRARLRREFQAGEEELERRRAKVSEAEHQLELQQRALEEARLELEKVLGPHESAPFEAEDGQGAGDPEGTARISPPPLEATPAPQAPQPPQSDGAECSELHGQSTSEPLEGTERTSPRESSESLQTQQPEFSGGTTCGGLSGHVVVEPVDAPEGKLGRAQAPQPLPLDGATLERARALGLYDAVRRQCYERSAELADPPAPRRGACEDGCLQPPRPEVPDSAVAHARALGLGDAVRGRCYQRALERAEAAAQESRSPPLEGRRVSFGPPSRPQRARLDTEAASAESAEDEEELHTETAPQDLRRVSTYSLEDRYEALTTMAKYVQVRVSNAGETPDTEDLRALWEVFQACDANGDGSINLRELIKACREIPEVAAFFGLPSEIQQESASRQAVMEFFQSADVDNDREITWEELCRAHRRRSRAGSRRSSRSPRLRLASRGAQDDRRHSTCSLEARYEALSPKGMLAVEDARQQVVAGSRLAALEGATAARGAAVAEAEERLAHVRALLSEARASAARLREEVDEVERRRLDARDSARAREERLRRELEVALGRLRDRRAPQPEASWLSMFGASFCCSRAGGTPAAPPPPAEALSLAGAASDEGALAPAGPAAELAGAADAGAPAAAGPGGAPSEALISA